MYRDNLSGFVNLCRSERVSLSGSRQNDILQACRFALWHQHGDELQSLFMACGMGESEIIERKEFYLKFAAMIGHMIVMVPNLANYFMLDYIAEDMIDGGDPELAEAGMKLQVIIRHGKNHEEKIVGQVTMPSLPVLSEAKLNFYRKNQAAFIAEFLESNWTYDSDRFYGLAVTAELLSLDPEDRAQYGEMLMGALGKFSNREEFFQYFATTTARILYENNYSDWAALTLDVFSPLCGKLAEDLNRPTAPQARRGDLPPIPPELELANIADIWKTQGIDEALELARKRIELTPGDAFSCGMLGNIFLAKFDIAQALTCLSRAYWLAPDSAMVVFVLAQAYHAGYFEKQVDLCLEKLHAMPEYRQNPDEFLLGVELFLKCDIPVAQATLDGRPVGRCPLQLRGIRPGHHKIVWKLADGKQYDYSVKLEDATVAKFRYHPVSRNVSQEISRCGSITIFHDGEARLLSDVVAVYLVDDLAKLPHPDVTECIGKVDD
ncbi:MAG: hypothetical protein CVV42_13420 [Candidatus Riflebacteria bacterium HGW-Riflebacteria-2]|jgi:tetratricopeptide (TPR) repeat protein|nr:MAG: hypothetical protein CVV42_13420 [Candidatus Riflebacteria bacterium HGW-Riflebacteria-2]